MIPIKCRVQVDVSQSGSVLLESLFKAANQQTVWSVQA